VGTWTILIAMLAGVLAAPAHAEASGRPVTFASADGTSIAAELFEASPRPAPGVVLVHMLSRNKGDWGNLGDRLQDAGITALAIDLRGHGNSSGSALSLPDMVQDVRAAVLWLSARQGVRPDAIGIVGASLGASLAMLASADLPAVRVLALLSPSLDYRGLRADSAVLKQIGGRAIWLAAATDDPYALRSVREIAANASGPRDERLVNGQAHGTRMLGADAELGRSLVDWLRRSLLS
jgi:alpha-beta hydrolase superfamily lysophospholipase